MPRASSLTAPRPTPLKFSHLHIRRYYVQHTMAAFRVNVSQTGKSLCASLALFAFPFLYAHADDFDSWNEYGYATAIPSAPKPGFHAVERLGITVGGDIISKITHPDGTFREISAGGLYQIGLGVLYQWDVDSILRRIDLQLPLQLRLQQ